MQSGILATILIAPVMIICCGGGAAFPASILAGMVGTLSGLTALASVVVAALAYLVIRALRRSCRAPETQIQEEAG